MVIVSDYSGQHKGATHEAYSFLLTTQDDLVRWIELHKNVRGQWLPDGRRISFKDLREPLRRRALGPFLAAANAIHGNLITFLVDRRIGSFMHGGAAATIEAFDDVFVPAPPAGTVEKMLRIGTFVSLLLAGLRREDQPCIWFSDEDEVLDSFQRREQLGKLSSNLAFGLTRWTKPADLIFGTTTSPDAPVWIEDAATIPDLAAGAFCKLASLLPTSVGRESWTRVVESNVDRDPRAREIGNWMALGGGDLRHVFVRLEMDDQQAVRSSAQAFLRPSPM